VLSAADAKHFVFGSFILFGLEDAYRNSNERIKMRSMEECIQSLFLCWMALNIPGICTSNLFGI
jgi:hypothetical protein